LSFSRDTQAINAVINHPAVCPHVGDPAFGVIDAECIVANLDNLFPMGEHGGFALIQTAPGEREVHTFILPEGRGKWGYDAAQVMIGVTLETDY